MKIRAFLFDVDGTLVDSNHLHAEAWERSFATEGKKIPAAEVLRHIGKGSDKLVPSLLPEAKDDEALAERLKAQTPVEFARLLEQQGLRPFPRARELLGALHARGMRIAIATSAKRDDFEKIVKKSGLPLTDEVDEIVTGEDVEQTKPHPEIVDTALAAVGLDASECLMVGDTPYDAEASVRASVLFVGVLTGVHDEAALRAAGASYVFSDVAALEGALDDLLRGSP